MHGCLRLLVAKQTHLHQIQHASPVFKMRSRHSVVKLTKSSLSRKMCSQGEHVFIVFCVCVCVFDMQKLVTKNNTVFLITAI